MKQEIYKAINIRAYQDHPDKHFQAQMMGLFKHNAYKRKLSQAEFFAICMAKLYNDDFLDVVMSEDPTDQALLDEIMEDGQ